MDIKIIYEIMTELSNVCILEEIIEYINQVVIMLHIQTYFTVIFIIYNTDVTICTWAKNHTCFA